MYQLTNSDMETLEQALNDQLSEAATGELQKRLSEDPDFKAEAEKFLQTYTALRAVRRQHWRTHLQQEAAKSQPPQKLRPNPRRWMLVAAAVLALAAAAIWFWPPSSPPQSAAMLAAREALDAPIWRGATMSAATADQLRSKAGAAYNAGQYKEAAAFLRTYFEQNPGPDADLELMLGVALLQSEQPAEALDVLSRRKTNPAADPYETDWYRALALLMLERGEEARGLLNRLSEAPNAYQNDAKKLAEKIF